MDNCASSRSQPNNMEKDSCQTAQAELIWKDNFDHSYTLFFIFNYIICI